MAKTTAMASGVNRYRAVPVSSSTGTNTMQIASVETKVGTAICAAPSITARTSDLRMPMLRCVFSIATVASSTSMPTASARPPSVITLMVWPEQAQDAERRQDGERNRDADDQRAAPASEKQQNHHAGEGGGDQRFAHHALNGGAHEDRLVGQRDHFQLRRDVGQNRGKRRLYGIDDRESGGLAVAGDGHQDAAGAVGADDVVLHRKAVADLRHILDVDGRAVDGLDGQVVQFIEYAIGLLLTLI